MKNKKYVKSLVNNISIFTNILLFHNTQNLLNKILIWRTTSVQY